MIRPGIVLLGLLLWTSSLLAQQTTPSSVDMPTLQQEVDQLTSALQAMRSEVQSCRDEIRNLRTQLETAEPAQPGGSESAVDVAHALADLREDQSVTDSRLAT